MKRILQIIVVSGLLTAAPAAFAGIDVFIDFITPAPVYVAPPPPVVIYRYREPRWHDRREHFKRREFREHHKHYWHHDRH